jgi:hypothetical protein
MPITRWTMEISQWKIPVVAMEMSQTMPVAMEMSQTMPVAMEMSQTMPVVAMEMSQTMPVVAMEMSHVTTMPVAMETRLAKTTPISKLSPMQRRRGVARARARARATSCKRLASSLQLQRLPTKMPANAKMPAVPKAARAAAPKTANAKVPAAPKVANAKVPAAPKVANAKLPAAPKVDNAKAPAAPKVANAKLPAAPKVDNAKVPAVPPKLANAKVPAAPKVDNAKVPAPKVDNAKVPAAPKADNAKVRAPKVDNAKVPAPKLANAGMPAPPPKVAPVIHMPLHLGQEDTVFCSLCCGHVGISKSRRRSKSEGTWKCLDCCSTLVKASQKGCMPNFQGKSAENIADFFANAKGLSSEHLMCLSTQFLEKYQEKEQYWDESGEFWPESYWATLGLDTALLRTKSRPEDIKEHPVWGTTYLGIPCDLWVLNRCRVDGDTLGVARVQTPKRVLVTREASPLATRTCLPKLLSKKTSPAAQENTSCDTMGHTFLWHKPIFKRNNQKCNQ